MPAKAKSAKNRKPAGRKVVIFGGLGLTGVVGILAILHHTTNVTNIVLNWFKGSQATEHNTINSKNNQVVNSGDLAGSNRVAVGQIGVANLGDDSKTLSVGPVTQGDGSVFAPFNSGDITVNPKLPGSANYVALGAEATNAIIANFKKIKAWQVADGTNFALVFSSKMGDEKASMVTWQLYELARAAGLDASNQIVLTLDSRLIATKAGIVIAVPSRLAHAATSIAGSLEPAIGPHDSPPQLDLRQGEAYGPGIEVHFVRDPRFTTNGLLLFPRD